GDVDGDRGGFAARGPDLGRHGSRPLTVEIGDNDSGAALGKHHRRAPADSSAGTGDDGDAALQRSARRGHDAPISGLMVSTNSMQLPSGSPTNTTRDEPCSAIGRWTEPPAASRPARIGSRLSTLIAT